MGSVVTFYSYKGGVGRSMALANIAVLLSQEGRRVLVIDWDLEAPGLERYFQYFQVIPSGPGLLPLLTDGMNSGGSYRDYTWTIEIPSGEPITFLPSGREQDPAGYSRQLEGLDWTRFFKRGGGDYLEELRRVWKKDFDTVLIDSRTGLSDTGGVCTIQLPDVVVVMFTANEQSMLGARDVMRYARKARQSLAYPRMQLTVFPLPSRFSSVSEFQESQKWIDRFSEEFDEFYDDWLPSSAQPREVLQKVKIPQVDFFSFGEKLSVVEQGVSDPGGMGYVYDLVARVLADDFENAHLALGLREQSSDRQRKVRTSETADDYRYDLYVSSADLSYMNKWSDRFLEILRFELSASTGNEDAIFIDRHEVLLGESLPDSMRHALLHSRLLLPILTPAYFSSTLHMAEWRTFELRESLTDTETSLIVPVVLRKPRRYPEFVMNRLLTDVTTFPPRPSDWTKKNIESVRHLAERIAWMLRDVPPFRPDFPLVNPADVVAEIPQGSELPRLLPPGQLCARCKGRTRRGPLCRADGPCEPEGGGITTGQKNPRLGTSFEADSMISPAVLSVSAASAALACSVG
jgi:MinD-like ATPase involved in chromosome partitioning or flagellar assembly